MLKKYTLWPVHKIKFRKSLISQKYPIQKYFIIRYQHKIVKGLGGFIDPITPEIIYDFINNEEPDPTKGLYKNCYFKDMVRKYTLWDTQKVSYHKSGKLIKRFYLKYNNNIIKIGAFLDFLTPIIIYDLITDFV